MAMEFEKPIFYVQGKILQAWKVANWLDKRVLSKNIKSNAITTQKA